GTRNFLERLDAKALREEKIANRSKYELTIPEQVYINDDQDMEYTAEKIPTISEILCHAIHHQEQVEFFNMDLLLRYNSIAALRKETLQLTH
ncbi:hypothetical protein HHI36_001137, partial [Cryptolaemus montrouzieri]